MDSTPRMVLVLKKGLSFQCRISTLINKMLIPLLPSYPNFTVLPRQFPVLSGINLASFLFSYPSNVLLFFIMARTELEEEFITVESQNFIDMFGLTEKTNYQSWANVYREFFGKPAKGTKSALIAEISKFLLGHPLPKIVEIHRKMEEGRIK